MKAPFISLNYLLTLLFFSHLLRSQTTGVYFFTTGTGGSLTTMTGSTQLVAAATDDGASSVTNIGFTFTYGGCTNYTQFSVNSNGLMRLGSSAVSTAYTNSLLNGADDCKITAYWDDISTGTSGSGSKVHYLLTGSAPNRVLTVEWLVRVPVGTSSAYNSRFQVQLYETSNIIKFVYGTVVTGTSYSVGLTVSSTDFLSVTTSSNTASLSSVNNSQTASITSGRYYTFTPETYSSNTAKTYQATTANVTKCGTGQAIIAIQVVSSSCSATLTQIQINMTGSTAPTSDVTKIHVYFTGASPDFLGVTKFDGTGTNPATGTITITGSQALQKGNNFFWVAYDMNTSATTSNVVDAQCTSVTFGGSSYTPSVTSPTGSRTIAVCPTTTLANYALTSNMADGTGTYGNATKSGGATGPTASGIYSDGNYLSTDLYTATITALDQTNFQISCEASVSTHGQSILVGNNASRWVSIGTTSDGYAYFYFSNWGYYFQTTQAISTSTYYTYKLLYNAGFVQLYVDGHLVYETSSAPSSLSGTKNFYITDYSSGLLLHGYIRNIIISNTSNASASFTTLPVELASYGLHCEQNKVKIEWTTINETNNNFFTLERSEDAINFFPIAFINGAGNSREEIRYSYQDDIDLNDNVFYYCLSQTDYDGQSKKLALIPTECQDFDNELKIVSIEQHDNHYRLNFFSSNHNKEHVVEVFDLHGKVVYSQRFMVNHNFNSLPFQLSGGANNMYIIVISNDFKKASRKHIANM